MMPKTVYQGTKEDPLHCIDEVGMNITNKFFAYHWRQTLCGRARPGAGVNEQDFADEHDNTVGTMVIAKLTGFDRLVQTFYAMKANGVSHASKPS